MENLGCAKNQVDAEVMINALQSEGWLRTLDPAEADFIIVNTCGFIEPAKKESVDVLISYRDAFPDAVVIAAGCLSERYSADLSAAMPELDGIFGNASLSRITDFIRMKAETDGQLVMVPALDEVTSDAAKRDDIFSIGRAVLLSGPSSAYVKLAEGCSNNCSFCAIPLIRGPLRSRAIKSVVEEIKHLTESGILEINLIAQDLGSYGVDLEAGGDGPCLLFGLLSEIDKLSGDFIVRMLYIHPDNFPLEILDICAESSKILPYFDIPFQHASAEILRTMNRKGSSEKHLDLLGAIRKRLPEAVIRTTFLVGFPGEGKADTAELEQFITTAKLEWAGFFSYSREEDTPAYNMETERKHKSRHKSTEKNVQRMQGLQSAVTTEAFGRFIGRKLRLFVEEAVEKEDLYLCRAWFQAPEVDGLVVLHADEGSLKPGSFVEAEVTGINGIDLEAVLRA
ncbi:MAG: 30S ribosomal protein S12 methylthiotransferase RimO [Spirochaetales bacterium]|nr:30S ribosomal protein S12 methylthiotransferase RimO [Spirochaetales bacterium]